MMKIPAFLLALFWAAGAHATCSAVPFTFSPNTLAQSAQVNSNFASVVSCANSLDATQITSGNVNPSRLTGSYGGITSLGTLSSLAVSGQSALTGGVVGTTTNNNAAAGIVGEFFTNFIPFGSATPLTSGLAGNIVSVNLTAGDWDVRGYLGFGGNAATTIQFITGSLSSVSGVIDFTPGHSGSQVYSGATPLASLNDIQFAVGYVRYSLAAPTTIYLTEISSFAVNTLSGFGMIEARRVR